VNITNYEFTLIQHRVKVLRSSEELFRFTKLWIYYNCGFWSCFVSSISEKRNEQSFNFNHSTSEGICHFTLASFFKIWVSLIRTLHCMRNDILDHYRSSSNLYWCHKHMNSYCPEHFRMSRFELPIRSPHLMFPNLLEYERVANPTGQGSLCPQRKQSHRG
jgi:hypothetical protein